MYHMSKMCKISEVSVFKIKFYWFLTHNHTQYDMLFTTVRWQFFTYEVFVILFFIRVLKKPMPYEC